jgi:hypothetical protein
MAAQENSGIKTHLSTPIRHRALQENEEVNRTPGNEYRHACVQAPSWAMNDKLKDFFFYYMTVISSQTAVAVRTKQEN